jgi:tetratricopeptide (TPR) repeat protein
MKKLAFLIISFSFLAAIACTDLSQMGASPSAVPTSDPNLLGNIIVETADAAFTQTALHASPTFSPTPTFIPGPSAILITTTPAIFSGGYRPGDPTATPFGTEITDPNFIAGLEAFNNRDYGLTIELMSKVIEVSPNLAPPYRYRGSSQIFFENCTASMEDAETALSLNPEYAAAWAVRGMADECSGDIDQMMVDYQKALSIDPSLSFVHHNLGYYYMENGEYEKTLQEYTLALEIDPNRALNWSSMADLNFKLGQYQECIINANKALEVDPEYWFAYSNRAFCQDFMGNNAASLKDYKIYVEHADADATTWYNLGLNQRETGDNEAAVISYTKALELDPSYYAAHINRGNVYIDLEEYQKALDDFNIAIQISDQPNAYSGRGDAYYGLKKYDKAIEDFNMALSLDPGKAHYYCMLSLSYFEIEEYQDSIDAAEISLEINPDCGGQKLVETTARSHYALKNYDQALVYINKALAMDDYDLGHYYRGIIYQTLGNNQEAIKDLELFTVQAQPPEKFREEIADAKARLEKLKK